MKKAVARILMAVVVLKPLVPSPVNPPTPNPDSLAVPYSLHARASTVTSPRPHGVRGDFRGCLLTVHAGNERNEMVRQDLAWHFHSRAP